MHCYATCSYVHPTFMLRCSSDLVACAGRSMLYGDTFLCRPTCFIETSRFATVLLSLCVALAALAHLSGLRSCFTWRVFLLGSSPFHTEAFGADLDLFGQLGRAMSEILQMPPCSDPLLKQSDSTGGETRTERRCVYLVRSLWQEAVAGG